MKIGDTFVAPTGPTVRFPERQMRVIKTMTLDGQPWIDAVPVTPVPGDQYWHSTYQLDENGRLQR